MTSILDQFAGLSPEKRELLRIMLEEQGIEASGIFPRKRDGSEPPLSFAQQRLWFLDQLEPGSTQYNIPVAVRIAGDLDGALFEQSINAIVERHEVLRTSFSAGEGEPVQRIAPELHIDVPVVDLSLLAEDKPQMESRCLIDAEATRPFDLAKGPLVRAILFKVAEHEHIALFTMHHIVSDGWSMGVFTREILAVYEALKKGAPSPLSPLPIQYADFALWQRQQLRGDELNDQLEYWKERLSGRDVVLELPTDRPRPTFLSSNGASYGFELPSELAEAVKSLGRKEDATLFMTMLAAFQTLLHLYTGAGTIQVGVPFAGRDRAELEDLIGFFVNTLVLGTEFDGDPTFREILREVRKSAIEAHARQNAPFEMLVEKLHPERSTSRTPLFQVMFTMQNASDKPRSIEGLSLSTLETGTRVSNFELTLSMEEQAGGLRGAFEYSTDLFDAATIARMAVHLRRLLEGIAEAPCRKLSTLTLLTEPEHRNLLRGWNDTSSEFPDLCLHQLFQARARENPEAVALVLPGDKGKPRDLLSYGELNRRANRLANYLRKRAIGPEMPVGIFMESSLETIIGILGILKAGGCYVPLDPSYPPERIAYMAEDAGLRVILTLKKTWDVGRGTLDEQGKKRNEEGLSFFIPRPTSHVPRSFVFLDTDWPAISRESDENPIVDVTPSNLAYLIYTSGSTGKPKGVMVPHRAVVNHNAAVTGQFRLHRRDRVLQFANISFDAAVEEIFPALLSGATVVLRPSAILPTLEMISEWIETEGITILDLPTAYWHELVSQREHSRRPVPAPLRLVVVGGEEPSGERLAAWQESAGAEREWMNTYGPTETTVIATSFSPGPETWNNIAKIPMGRPIANARVHVLNGSLQPVPVGVWGELHIGGVGVSRGYLGRPDLTAERFIPDPFEMAGSQSPTHQSRYGDGARSEVGGQIGQGGGRLYRTGDLARFLADGNVEFLGRMDDQVKVRGFRVELSEIEAALRRHPEVEDGVVLAWESESGNKQLVAYAAGNDKSLEATRLRSFLKGWLPDYMIPSAFVIMDALPLTPSGKVDRRGLPAPDRSRTESEEGYERARTPVEEIIGKIFTHVLGVKEVGIHDNFFDLGGHSLLATQVISRLPGAFRVELPLRTIFETPTVAGLSAAVEKARLAERSVPIPPIGPVSRDEEPPLSFAQQRLWFLDQLEPENPFYNIPDAVRISGPLDIGVLERCFNEIIRRHEALRTAFKAIGGKPVQVIHPRLEIRLEMIDLGHLNREQREEEALRTARRAAQEPFDLTQPPLLRAQVLRLTEEEHILLFILHHIVGDNWSMEVLVQEAALLYVAFQRGQPSPLTGLPIQYADFAHWQREWLRGEALENQLQYWRKQLAGLPPQLELPTDRPRPPVQTFPGACRSFALPEELSGQIRRLCGQKAVTTFMVLLAGFQALLHRYTGQPDICVGSPIANRNRREIENLIGFFVNTLALRTDLSNDPAFGELLARVRETALGAYAHQDLPFEMIVDALQPQRNMSHTPLFQVVFALQTAPGQTRIKPDSTLGFTPIEVDSGTAKFDLTLFMAEEGNRISGAMEYNTDLFDLATIDRMLNHFEVLLTGAVNNPNQRLSELPALTEHERRQLLLVWGDTQSHSPENLCAHELFEARAAGAPDAIALCDAGGALTYAELNRRADRVAIHLQGSGVGPESVVGLCAERSLEMVTGMLGILKAGGAYLPLDPDYPPERLSFMVEDAGAGIILTQEKFKKKCCELRVAGCGSRVEGSEFRSQGSELDTTLDQRPSTKNRPPATRRVLSLDTDFPNIPRESDERPIVDVDPANLAYVIYTSGSTGRPKGVGIEHRGLLNLIFWHRSAFSISPEERATQVAAPGFDASVWEIWPYITSGASVHIPDEAVRAAPSLMKEWLLERHITISFLPTPMAEAVLSLKWPKGAALRTLLTGGDRLHQVASGDLPFELVNNYGPTENTVVATSGVIAADGADILPPIGRAVSNTCLYVLCPHLNLAPIGTAGELHIAGRSLARCYIQHPELTAEKFVPNPFSSTPGGRFYKTGDLVRCLPDGAMEFLGRIDHQVKLRGFRIELGEIESAMKSHPSIKDAVALVREDKPGDRRLIAYVAAGEKPLNVNEMREFLKSRLPGYMVPSIFVAMESLPLNASGKVDRKALPLPESARPEMETAYVAPRTPEEETLAGIWTQILGVDRVGIHDNFFELGGDSILSIQVVARANQQGLRLTPKELFLNPTVAGSAAVARTRHAILPEKPLEQGPAPLTPIQRWFFEQDFPEPHHWNQSLMLEMNESPRPALLAGSIESLARHHEALGLRFLPLPLQGPRDVSQIQAGPEPEPLFTWIDLSAIPVADVNPTIESLAAPVQGSLNLSSGPLFRMVFFDFGTVRSNRLLIVLHHLATDGISWRILLEDLHLAYGQLLQGEPVSLPPQSAPFRQWARRLVEHAQSQAVKGELSHWLASSEGALSRLPVDFPGGDNSEATARHVTFSLCAEETRSLLRESFSVYRIGVEEMLLAALVQAISRWTGSRTLLVDLEGHGRETLFEDLDISRTVGWFTSLYPVALALPAAGGLRETLIAVKEQLRKVPGKGVGYGLLRYLCTDAEASRRMRSLPRPEISFNYLGQFGRVLPEASPFRPAPESRGPERSLRGRMTHLLEISGLVAEDRLQVEWVYSTNAYRPGTIENLAGEHASALRALMDHCRSPEAKGGTPSDFDLAGLDQRKLDKLLTKFNQPKSGRKTWERRT